MYQAQCSKLYLRFPLYSVFYYPHSTCGETEAWRLRDLPKEVDN